MLVHLLYDIDGVRIGGLTYGRQKSKESSLNPNNIYQIHARDIKKLLEIIKSGPIICGESDAQFSSGNLNLKIV